MQVFVRIITWSHTDPTLHVLDYIYICTCFFRYFHGCIFFLSSPISPLLPRPHSTFLFFIFYFVLFVLFPYFLPFYFLCIVLYSLFFILLPSYSDIFYFIFLFSHPHPHTVSCLLIPNSYNPGAAFFSPLLLLSTFLSIQFQLFAALFHVHTTTNKVQSKFSEGPIIAHQEKFKLHRTNHIVWKPKINKPASDFCTILI